MLDATDTPPLLEVVDAVRHFPVTRGVVWPRIVGSVRAVDGVSFSIARGETVGLVGESGCGKSSLARVLLRLEPADSGRALLNGRNIFELSGEELLAYRRSVQMVFQDPYSSLNPRASISASIFRAWEIHDGVVPREHWRARAMELLRLVGLPPDRIDWYPHQLSGGQRQRASIARALSLEPKLVVCDEAVSALDVSVQAQVLHLLAELQERLQISFLFISHDLGVVRRIARRVLVMYLGRIVEAGPADEVMSSPAHPYTRALLAAAPVADPENRSLETRKVLQGDPPSPEAPPTGCNFRGRCPIAQEICGRLDPALSPVGAGNQAAACHFPFRSEAQPMHSRC